MKATQNRLLIDFHELRVEFRLREMAEHPQVFAAWAAPLRNDRKVSWQMCLAGLGRLQNFRATMSERLVIPGFQFEDGNVFLEFNEGGQAIDADVRPFDEIFDELGEPMPDIGETKEMHLVV